MPGPLVTVVTPCFNPGWRLRRCLDSVAAQTYPQVEHLVIDAQSTDGTLELLQNRAVRWVSEPDSGQSDAINKGFRMAHGSVLTWLNADDMLLPNAVADAVRALDGGRAGWVYGDVDVVGDGRRRTLRPPRQIEVRHFAVTNHVPQPGTFLTRAAWDVAGPLDESLHYSMDVDLWLRLLRKHQHGVHSGAAHAVFEVHGESKGGSVPFAEFLWDTGRACLRNGHQRLAAAYFGRAAAHRAVDAGGTGGRDVQASLDAARAACADDDVVWKAASASAHAQAALLSMRRRKPAGAVALLRPRVWTDPLARALVTNAARGRASQPR